MSKEQRHSEASRLFVIAEAKAGRIGPRFMQTTETLADYEAAQAEVEAADLELTNTRLSLEA